MLVFLRCVCVWVWVWGCLSMFVCACVCVACLSTFVSALGSHEMGRPKLPIVILITASFSYRAFVCSVGVVCYKVDCSTNDLALKGVENY